MATINLATGERHDPRPKDYITKVAGTRSDSNMPTPLWEAFLKRATNGDQSLQNYVQRMCGYSLTGHTHEHVLFFLYGTGANGKSVFINTINGIMGDYAVTAPLDLFVATRNEQHPTGLAHLRGARLRAREGNDCAARIAIAASILRDRLPITVLVAIYRNHVVYGEALEKPGLIRLSRDIDDGLTYDDFRKFFSFIDNADKETRLAVDQITPEHLRGVQELIAKRALPPFALAFVDFVELCERKEAETGKPCVVVVDY
jgi:hypothetical protein